MPLAFEAAGGHVFVRAAFVPRRARCPGRFWTRKGHEIEFRPFLVILEDAARPGVRSVWMPYWHLDTDPVTGRVRQKYGQWAPLMDESCFNDLVEQAATAGYGDGESRPAV